MSLKTLAHSGSTNPVAVGGSLSRSVALFTIAGRLASELRVPMPTTLAGTMARAKVSTDTRPDSDITT